MNNIVSFQAFHMAKNFPAISGVIEYWTKLGQLGDIARRSDIDPRLLGESLPYIFYWIGSLMIAPAFAFVAPISPLCSARMPKVGLLMTCFRIKPDHILILRYSGYGPHHFHWFLISSQMALGRIKIYRANSQFCH